MEVIIQESAQAASLLAASFFSRLIRRKADAVLGLATGRTPLLLYAELARLHREEGLDFSRVTAFNLDEYLSLGPGHPASYARFMKEKLFDHINISPGQTFIPNGLAENIPEECARYEKMIRDKGGIDLQVLGLGVNGHIGFNEPSSSLASRTRIKTLSRSTIRANADDFGGEDKVPRHVLTMGVGTVLDSRRCLVLAFGSSKAEAVAGMIEGPVTAGLPASALQLHPSVVVILDRPAAARLKATEYYEWVYSHKPEWQS